MNAYQALAYVRRTTGTSIRLGVLEEVADYKITDSKITVLVRRAEVESRRNGLVCKRTGVTLYTFTLTEVGTWKSESPFTCWDDDDPVLHTSSTRTEADRRASREWADLCYRPGTPADPMDNLDRKLQGYY